MKKINTVLSALALALLAIAGSAQAIPLSTLLQGGSITAGDKLFDQWQVTFQKASDPSFAFDFGAIEITALNDGGNDPGPGLNIDFGDQMSVTGDGVYAYRDVTLGFRVSTLGGELIVDNSLTFGDPPSLLTWVADGTSDLGMFVEEWVYNALDEEIAHKSIEFSVLDDVQTRDFPDIAAFAPQSQVFVVKNLLVWAVDDTDTASLNGVEQRFSQTSVPEPGTLALLAIALAGVAGTRRRAAAVRSRSE